MDPVEPKMNLGSARSDPKRALREEILRWTPVWTHQSHQKRTPLYLQDNRLSFAWLADPPVCRHEDTPAG